MADRPVGTIDLSGHGRSDWRPSYSFDTWAEEVTVAAEYLFPERLALVGHSLGGALVCRAVATGLQAQTVILLEAIGSSPRKIQSAVPVIRPPQLFSSCEEAEAAVIPRKKSRPADLAAHVVYASVEPYQRQWRMRCDPRVGSVPVEDTSLAQLGTTPPTASPSEQHQCSSTTCSQKSAPTRTRTSTT
ncbi:alpha/beta hydrolase [Pseudarthrobacter sp. NPDC055928]|uniref:alpha/beta hydrolase n=1 Tax=Pseudarthrobacter sp. NPDC055928 TaxID=3345661 RepID=UPI0035D8CA22